MHFRVFLNVLSLLEILHSHYDLSLRLPSLSFFQLNFVCAALSQQSFLLLFSFPISRFPFFPPDPLCLAINTSPPFYCCAPFNISAFLLAFFWVTSPLHFLCGQVAGQLAYCIHVPEMEITQEMFDEAMQFNTVQVDPTQCIYSYIPVKKGVVSVVWTWKLVLFSAVYHHWLFFSDYNLWIYVTYIW